MSDWLSRMDQVAFTLSVVLGLVCLVISRPRIARVTRRTAVATAALIGLGLLVRLLIPPAFIHSNLHGYGILDEILAFPAPADTRAYFGEGSFVVLGALERVFRGGWYGVVAANAVSGVVIVALAAVLASREGPGDAGLAVLALGALWPALVRTAASEDAHNLGLMFGMVALLAADGVRREGHASWAALGLAAGASVAALYCRHPFFVWPFLTLALAVPAGGARAFFRAPATLTTVAVAFVLCVPRLLELARLNEEATTYRLFPLIIGLATDPRFLLRHPILRPDESLLFTPALLVGVLSGVLRGSRMVIVLALGVALFFVTSLPTSFHPSYLEEYAFRLPMFGPALVLAGVGATRALQWISRSPHPSGAATAGLLAALTFAPAQGLARVWADVDPQQQEFALVKGPQALDGDAPPIYFPRADDEENYTLPVAALRSNGWVPVTIPEDGGPPPGASFFQGIGCFSWAISDLPRFHDDVAALVAKFESMPHDQFADLSADFWDDPQGAFDLLDSEPPRGIRPECQREIDRAVSFEPWGEVMIYRQQMPFAYFTTTRIPIGVWRMPRADAP